MRGHLRARLWTEVALSVMAWTAAAAAVLVPNWVELLFGVDPDQGSGLVEWAIAAAGLAGLVLAVAARADWRRLRATNPGRAEA